MAKKIIQHYQGCVGCGACVGLCPQFFQFNDETFKAELISGQPAIDQNPADPTIELLVDDLQLDDQTAELLTSSCCAAIIEVTSTDQTEPSPTTEI